MSADRQPGDGKSPAKRDKTVKGGRKSSPGRAGRKGRSKGKAKKPWKLPSVPLLAVWIAAVLFLAALIYFSRNSHRHSPETRIPSSTTTHIADGVPAEPVDKTPVSEPRASNGVHSKKPEPAGPAPSNHVEATVADPVKTPLPAGPVLPPKPVFSSSDLPPDPPVRKQAPMSVALNTPGPTPVPTIPPGPVPQAKPALGRIAIIIDDFGQNIEIAKKFLLLPFPVALSILPYQQHSKEIAELAHSHGKEVLLHCPMEPLGYPKADPGRGALLLSMSEDTIRQNIRTELDGSPYISGVNNHMGSRMTENAAAMKTVLGEVGRRGLFFIDSCTSPASNAYRVARELKIPSRKRDIFLDHNASPESVRAQVSRLIRKARIEGTALAIGHPHEATLKALQGAAEQFREQGIEVVHVRDLVSSP